MRSQTIECSFCGFRYDPDQHLACQSCPMHSNCSLVCCPACGYQTVYPERTFLVRLARHIPRLKKSGRHSRAARHEITLADVPPGWQAEIIGFSDGFPAERKAYLQAYGLVLHHLVQVVQHRPVTIIRLDNVELAIEHDLASGIQVHLSPVRGRKKRERRHRHS